MIWSPNCREEGGQECMRLQLKYNHFCKVIYKRTEISMILSHVPCCDSSALLRVACATCPVVICRRSCALSPKCTHSIIITTTTTYLKSIEIHNENTDDSKSHRPTVPQGRGRGTCATCSVVIRRRSSAIRSKCVQDLEHFI